VILNRVAGERHEAMLRAAITRHLRDLPVLGALPDDGDLRVESRHLGLVPAGERDHVDALLDRAAAGIGERLDIDGLIALAGPSPGGGALPAIPLPPLGRHIAVARDDAFLFTYEATLAGWRRHGAAVSFFSPLADEAPAPEADAIYLPGGYPELHAGRLAAATRFRHGLGDAAEAGKSVYGECGGYMMLGETLTAADGAIHRMAGLLPLRTSFAARRRHLGYRAAQLCSACRLGDAGARFRGHEFHYATIIEERGAEPLFRISDASACDLGYAGLRRGTVYGSFIHLIDRTNDRA
jgi:cobyrinic acid a,c-diamide synthase